MRILGISCYFHDAAAASSTSRYVLLCSVVLSSGANLSLPRLKDG